MLTKDERAKRKAERRLEIEKKYPALRMLSVDDREPVESFRFNSDTALAVMTVRKAYSMGSKNRVAIGTVTKGTLLVGDEIYIASNYAVIDKCKIEAISQFGRRFDSAPEGSMVQLTFDAPNVNITKGNIVFVKG